MHSFESASKRILNAKQQQIAQHTSGVTSADEEETMANLSATTSQMPVCDVREKYNNGNSRAC